MAPNGNQVESLPFIHSAALVTRPGEDPALQWIVETGLLSELSAFHDHSLGGAGTLTEHPPTRGASRGFVQLRVATRDLPAELVAQLPRRLRVAIA